jgi:pyrroloquinoline quinone biosynthesis protein B
MFRLLFACAGVWLLACVAPPPPAPFPEETEPYLFVLGVAQDGGYPHAGCQEPHCQRAWRDPALRRNVTSLAIVDPSSRERWIIDATPDFPEQLEVLDRVAPPRRKARRDPGIDGILLTHAHIGHYTGLIHLGREVLGTTGVPVYVMTRMMQFLAGNGPWDQLVELKNISLVPMRANEPIRLNERIHVTPLPVPHRDEYSETVGFRIDGPQRSVLFIPDIDKWERWDRPIEELVMRADVALLDGTFYAEAEVPGRSMAEIPHPFIVESMERFAALAPAERRKVRFIHLNHTNPALQLGSEARRRVEAAGFQIAEQYERIGI